MRSKTMLPLAVCCGFLMMILAPGLSAQEKKYQKFVIHEDVVMPHKVMDYEKASKKFVESLTQHAGPEAEFMALSTDDMRYIYISPIENMAALDKSPFAKMEEAIGKDGMKEVFSVWDGTYETHKDYILNLSMDLSYNSGEILEEGIYFRHFDYYYINPDKMSEARDIAKEWKELYASKDVPYGFRVYTGGMGTEPMLMVVQWAKDAGEYYSREAEVREMLGDDAKELWERTLAITNRIEAVDGWMRPELSFMPSATMADN